MPNAIEAIEYRKRRISNTTDPRDLDVEKADFEGYIDALRDFDHISEDDHTRFQKESKVLFDETALKLKKKSNY